MLYKNTLPTDDDFDVWQQKMAQLKQLLVEIEQEIKRGGTVKTCHEKIKRAKKLRDECDTLKSNIQYKINKNIH